MPTIKRPASPTVVQRTDAQPMVKNQTIAATTTTKAAVKNEFPTDPHKMDIVCPVLGSLVAAGKLKMSPEGEISLKDLRAAVKSELGLTTPVALALTAAGFLANTPKNLVRNLIGGEMNLLDLRAGPFKHAADSAILTAGKFDEQKFQALVSHAKNGVMSETSFGEAIAANMIRDGVEPKKAVDQGRGISELEFGVILNVFGRKDPATGERGIPVEALRGLFQDKKLPAYSKSGAIDLLAMRASLVTKVDAALAATALGSTATATGLAMGGARLSEGGVESSKGAAAIGAGKAAACPYLNGAVQMPQQPNGYGECAYPGWPVALRFIAAMLRLNCIAPAT